jgi:hypothetical protein
MRLRLIVLVGVVLAGVLAGVLLSGLPQADQTTVPEIVLKQVTDIEEEGNKESAGAEDRERERGSGARQGPLPKPVPAGQVVGDGVGATGDTDDDRATGDSNGDTAADDADEDGATDDANTDARGTNVPQIDDEETDDRGLGDVLGDNAD